MTPLYIFDLDGTLALNKHRKHFLQGESKDWACFFAACVDDEPNTPVIRVMQTLMESGAEVWVFSGRSDEVRPETITWLTKHAPFFVGTVFTAGRIIMREAGDYTPDHKLKRQWLDDMLPSQRERLVCVFDDRDSVVEMWRDAGVACLQVASGDF